MKRPLNPFDPGRPIPPGQFVGRHAEIAELEAALSHTKAGRPRHFLLTGDRGIGKTSFLDYLRQRATDPGRKDGFNFLVVDFSINKNTTRLDFARALQLELANLLSAQDPLMDVLGKAWSFIQNFEVAGVAYKGGGKGDENHQDMYQAVADSLCAIVNKSCGTILSGYENAGYDGLLILVDEVDQASEDLDIGSFLKYLLERLNRKNCHRVVFGLAGLSSSTETLVRSHPSSLRIFDELPVGALEWDDVDELFAEAELQVRSECSAGFRFSIESKRRIFELSGGHPHFVHQFGYYAFEQACKNVGSGEIVITEQDVMRGAIESRGALDIIGDMYFSRPYESISDEEVALDILNYMSEKVGSTSLSDLGSVFLDEDALVTSLATVVRAGFVISDQKRTEFRFRHPCFGYWVQARLLVA